MLKTCIILTLITIAGALLVLHQNLTIDLQPLFIPCPQVPDLPSPTEESVHGDMGGFVHSGGHHVPPSGCGSDRVAVIIPYRDRRKNLERLLNYLHPFLQRQRLEYKVYVVEQRDDLLFNRGALLNIGYTFAQREMSANKILNEKTSNATSSEYWPCFIFHDVDLLPVNENNLYACGEKPRHLNTASSKYNYSMPYPNYIGGVVNMRSAHLEQLNGFSNRFFGWGGEDDDLGIRMKARGVKLERIQDGNVGRYEALSHPDQPLNTHRLTQLQFSPTFLPLDGLSSLDYDLLNVTAERLYTNVSVALSKDRLCRKPETVARIMATSWRYRVKRVLGRTALC